MSQDHLQQLASDTLPFGEALATAVAGKLRTGTSIGYAHRDYCGTGLDYNEGHYRYGEIWDGYLEPALTFTGQQDFIIWLAAQSTESLARLDDDAFYRGNQVITRERLEDFLR